MITVDHTADYPYSAEAVFTVLSDLEGYPAWQSDVLEAHVDGPPREGAAVAQVRKVMGRRTELDLTITEYVPGELITIRTAAGARPGVTQRYAVRPFEDGCRVEFRLELDGVPKMAEHLVRAQLGKQVPLLFERLGALLEA
ncbi:SRPBCC family protein [Sphaerisporangium fuscum]|uniref:SRPBCC family protein n=1 Tax=Sphaerisporangium fuscum TaxID=2835868 RepID=UPI001BDBE4F4|nr:SRPBCC family protein [Sphaerisporangium fuscum]